MEILSQEIMSGGDCDDPDLAAIVEGLMLIHRDKWLRFVQSMVQDEADAEDVLQESVLKMLVRSRHFQSREHARMYLARIICNTAIEIYHMRRRNRRQLLPLHDNILDRSNPTELPRIWAQKEEVEKIRLLNLLAEELTRLPAKQYEAVRLTVMNSALLSLRNAGVAYDIPYSTLRHRRDMGLRRLRRFLQRALRATATS